MIKLDKGIVLGTLNSALALIKAYIDDRVATLSSSLLELDEAVDKKLPLSGGTLTGHLTGQYLTGTWLRGTADNALGTKPPRICVQDSSGWIYSRTPSQILGDIGAGNCEVLHFADKVVETSAWISDSTYAEYPYRASVTCSDVTDLHCADVIFDVTEAVSGKFAPICQTVADEVYIWAKEQPEAAITIQIEARKAVKQ